MIQDFFLPLYFNIILRISELVNVSGMVGLQKITTDYSSGPLIQCVKWVNNTVFFVISFNWCQTQKKKKMYFWILLQVFI